MVLDYIHKEISGLKEKQAQVVQQIQQAQRELQRLQDTNLVISGALQALNHVIDQSRLRAPQETTSASSQALVSTEETRALDRVVEDPDGLGF